MKKVIALLLIFFCLPIYAKSVQIDNLRLWAAPDHLRLVFDTSSPVAHTLFSLKNPDRLVIDIENARLNGELPTPDNDDPVIRRLRSGQREGGNLRVVLDLKQQIKPRSFVLKPNRQYGHRLVVDLYRNQGKGVKKRQKVVKTIEDTGLRDIVIAVDTAHQIGTVLPFSQPACGFAGGATTGECVDR